MDRIFATYQNGQIVLDTEADWDDGTRIEVRRIGDTSTPEAVQPSVRPEFLTMLNDPDRFGITEELWPQTDEERQLLIGHMEVANPLDLSSEECDAIEKERLAEKEHQKELMRKNWEETDGLFK